MKQNMARPGPRYPALLQLLQTSERVWNGSRVFFMRWDLSPSQFNLLNLLVGEVQGRNQIELSRLLITHRSNVTGLIDRLEARGLLERQATPGDRRAYRVMLTDQGAKLMREILPEYYEESERVWGGMPVARVQKLAADLAELNANIEALEARLTKGRVA